MRSVRGLGLLLLLLASVGALGGCLLAEPRPDPIDDAAYSSDSGAGSGNDAAASSDAGGFPPAAVVPQNVAISGGDAAATGDLAVVGLTDVALANMGIQITNSTAGGAPSIVASSATGTFAATIQGVAGDAIEIIVIADGVAGSILGPAVLVTTGDAADATAPFGVGDPTPGDLLLEFDSALVTIVADGSGTVTITGLANATSALAEVVAGNLTNGASATAAAAADGSFMLMIAGDVGDGLVLFARNAAGGAASQTQILTVM